MNRVLAGYPAEIRQKILVVRSLILDVAARLEGVAILDETLKWGEPSYLTKTGSTIRLGWNAKAPDQYGIYFNCKSSLVETFKALYSDRLNFEGNRAIIFQTGDRIPEVIVRHCVSMALRYHRIKHLPLLGA